MLLLQSQFRTNHTTGKLHYSKSKFQIPFSKIAPFDININITLSEQSTALDPYSDVSIKREIRFDKNCGDDDKCDSKLKIKADSDIANIKYGPVTKLEINLEIENKGEHSYGSYLWIENKESCFYKTLS